MMTMRIYPVWKRSGLILDGSNHATPACILLEIRAIAPGRKSFRQDHENRSHRKPSDPLCAHAGQSVALDPEYDWTILRMQMLARKMIAEMSMKGIRE